MWTLDLYCRAGCLADSLYVWFGFDTGSYCGILTSLELYRPGWPLAPGNPPASPSCVLGLKLYVAMPGLNMYFCSVLK